MKKAELRKIIREELQVLIENEQPKDGDRLILVGSSGYTSPIWVKGDKIKVGNKQKGDRGGILAVKNKKAQKYNDYFYVKIKDIELAKGVSSGVWRLKSVKNVIDGKTLKFAPWGRGKVFGYVET